MRYCNFCVNLRHHYSVFVKILDVKILLHLPLPTAGALCVMYICYQVYQIMFTKFIECASQRCDRLVIKPLGQSQHTAFWKLYVEFCISFLFHYSNCSTRGDCHQRETKENQGQVQPGGT